MKEIRLEKSFFKFLGSDLETDPGTVEKHIDGEQVDEIEPEALESAAVSHQGLFHHGTGDDSTEPPEALSAAVVADSDVSDDAAFCNITNDAIENGLSFAIERGPEMPRVQRCICN